MTDAVTKTIADRYISRDGGKPARSRREKKLTPSQEETVLRALREIAKGRPGKSAFKFLPLKGPDARAKARQALADVMQPWT